MHKGVPQHAHVQNFLLMEQEKVGDFVVDHPSCRIDGDWLLLCSPHSEFIVDCI
jgi:hypothetical protein